ncbi:hypothetical protein ACFODW_13890 [Virgibacillus sediminis]|uniref:Tryptophan synthase beta chain-like PALP domain-containing protein n=1 Tax=Virgibacillus sediminis TaxID=202260 RepID=A0ABV7A8V3_9BACI
MNNIVLIAGNEIAYIMTRIMDKHRIILEGAAATGIATSLGKRISNREGKIAVIISGHNVGLSILLKLIRNYSFTSKG